MEKNGFNFTTIDASRYRIYDMILHALMTIDLQFDLCARTQYHFFDISKYDNWLNWYLFNLSVEIL